MEHKTISYRSSSLLSALHKSGQGFFGIEDAMGILEGSSEKAVRELIRSMVNRGLLLRIKDGLFHVIPYEADSSTYFPNWHVVASHLAEGRNFYIGYYSALQIHELTTQPSLIEQVVVDKQARPSQIMVKDVAFQFIYHNLRHFFGFRNTWIDDFHKVPVSDPEKTLIDCLYKPDYAGGIAEVAKALFKARKSLDFEKLNSYLERFGAQSVRKRLGYLLDGFGIERAFTKTLEASLSSSYTILDPSLPKEGKYISKWKILANLDEASIFSSIQT